jgi:hypothetical protein
VRQRLVVVVVVVPSLGQQVAAVLCLVWVVLLGQHLEEEVVQVV